MMYVNVVCTCAAQIILAFIFAMVSEPIEVYQLPSKPNTATQYSWEVRRDSLRLFLQECNRPIDAGINENDLKEPL